MSNEGWQHGDSVVVVIEGQRIPATIHESTTAGPLVDTPMVLVDLPAVEFDDGGRQPAGLYWVDPDRVSRADQGGTQ